MDLARVVDKEIFLQAINFSFKRTLQYQRVTGVLYLFCCGVGRLFGDLYKQLRSDFSSMDTLRGKNILIIYVISARFFGLFILK